MFQNLGESVATTIAISFLSTPLKAFDVSDALERKDEYDGHTVNLSFVQTALTICSTPAADMSPVWKGRRNFGSKVALRMVVAQILRMRFTTAMGRTEPFDFWNGTNYEGEEHFLPDSCVRQLCFITYYNIVGRCFIFIMRKPSQELFYGSAAAALLPLFLYIARSIRRVRSLYCP